VWKKPLPATGIEPVTFVMTPLITIETRVQCNELQNHTLVDYELYDFIAVAL
jgi:hypothetical protein